jgi:hypothetical protein
MILTPLIEQFNYLNPKIRSGLKNPPNIKMKKDTKTIIISLTPKNYHKWIKEIEGIATRANV